MLVISSVTLAYLLGAVPFGLLIAKAKGVDLRKTGSGNIGATNVTRILGKKLGICCFILDAFKGLLPPILTLLLVQPRFLAAGHSEMMFHWLWLVTGCAAILGHVFPVYLGFRGGKGVATSFGVALGIWPYFTCSALISISLWACVALKSRYISLASVVAAISFPVFLLSSILLVPSWTLRSLWPLMVIGIAIPTVVVVRHKKNITRIMTGSEAKIGTSP
jgi:glycerol-3-phosphate acyltransferase PlsY